MKEIILGLFFCFVGILCVWSHFYKMSKVKQCTFAIKGTYLGARGYGGKRSGILTTIFAVFDYDYAGVHYSDRLSCDGKFCLFATKDRKDNALDMYPGKEYIIYINPDKPGEFKTEKNFRSYYTLTAAILMCCIAVVVMFPRFMKTFAHPTNQTTTTQQPHFIVMPDELSSSDI